MAIGGFFLGSIPIAEKSMSLVKRGHKIRTREKRALKNEIMMACATFFTQRMYTHSISQNETPQPKSAASFTR